MNGEALGRRAIWRELFGFDALSLYGTEAGLAAQRSPLGGTSKMKTELQASKLGRGAGIKRTHDGKTARTHDAAATADPNLH